MLDIVSFQILAIDAIKDRPVERYSLFREVVYGAYCYDFEKYIVFTNVLINQPVYRREHIFRMFHFCYDPEDPSRYFYSLIALLKFLWENGIDCLWYVTQEDSPLYQCISQYMSGFYIGLFNEYMATYDPALRGAFPPPIGPRTNYEAEISSMFAEFDPMEWQTMEKQDDFLMDTGEDDDECLLGFDRLILDEHMEVTPQGKDFEDVVPINAKKSVSLPIASSFPPETFGKIVKINRIRKTVSTMTPSQKFKTGAYLHNFSIEDYFRNSNENKRWLFHFTRQYSRTPINVPARYENKTARVDVILDRNNLREKKKKRAQERKQDRDDKVKPQMFSIFGSGPVSEAADQSIDTMQNLDTTLERINDLTHIAGENIQVMGECAQRGSEFIKTVTDKFEEITVSVGSFFTSSGKIWDYIDAIKYVFVILVSIYKKVTKDVWMIILSLVPSRVAPLLTSFISTILSSLEYQREVEGVKPQAPKVDAGKGTSWFTSNIAFLLVKVFFSFIGVTELSDSESKHLSAQLRVIDSKSVREGSVWLFNYISTELLKFGFFRDNLDYFPFLFRGDPNYEKVEAFSKRFTSFENNRPNWRIDIKADRAALAEFTKLREDIAVLTELYPVKFNENGFLAKIREVNKELREAFVALPPYLKEDKMRVKPYAINVWGKPGIGKSTTFMSILRRIIGLGLELDSDNPNFEEFKYERTPGIQYWSGYHGQPIVEYNDFGQVKSENMITQAIEELTQVIDDSSYMLDMASVEEKGQVYMVAKAVIVNSQKCVSTIPGVVQYSLSGGSHIARRFDLGVELVLADEYTTDGKLDHAKLGREHAPIFTEGVPDDLYVFKILPDLAVKDKVTTIKSINHFVRYVKESFFKHIGRSTDTRQRSTDIANAVDQIVKAQAPPIVEVPNPVGNPLLSLPSEKHSCCGGVHIDPENSPLDGLLKRLRNPEKDNGKHICLNCMHVEECVAVNYKRCPAFLCKECYNKAGELKIEGLSLPLSTRFSQSFTAFKDGFLPLANLFRDKLPVIGAITLVVTSALVLWRFFSKDKEEDIESALATVGKMKAYVKDQTGELVTKVKKRDIAQKVKAQGDHFRAYRKSVANSCNFIEASFEGKATFARVYNICGDVILITKHQFELFKRHPQADFVYVFGKKLQRAKLNTEEFINSKYVRIGTDLLLVKLNVAYYGKSHVKKFCTLKTLNTTSVSSICRVVRERDNEICFETALNAGFHRRQVVQGETTDRLILTTGCKANDGDCGVPFVLSDKPDAMGCIAGFHIGSLNNDTCAVAEMVCREDVEAALERLNTIDVEQMEVNPQGSSKTMDVLESKCEALDVMGKAEIVNRIPSKSKFKQTALYDVLEEKVGVSTITLAPLAPFIYEDKLIHPMCVGQNKISKTFDQSTIKMADIKEAARNVAKEMKDTIQFFSLYPKQNRRVFDMNESLGQIVQLRSMDLSTSPGQPYTGKGMSKNSMVKDGKIISPLLIESINNRIEKAKKGVVVATVTTDNLKDEKRKEEKALQGATRIFHVFPFDLQIVLRMYFGSFVSFCQNTYDEGEIAIGVNPDSRDWTRFYDELSKFGTTNCFAGDFSAYDSTVKANVVVEGMSLIVDMFYDDGPENAKIRKVLLMTLFQRFHLVHDVVHYRGMGNPSGNALTGVLNSVYLMIMFRIAFRDLTGKNFCEFRDHVALKVYGDDNIAGVSDEVAGLFHMLSIQAWFLKYGMVLTMADKVSETVAFRNLNQLTFLKRFFKAAGDSYIRAPFDKEDLWSELRYSTLDPRDNDGLSQIAYNVQRSHFHLGKEKFESCSSMIEEVFETAGIKLENRYLKSYDEMFDEMYVSQTCVRWNL